MMTRPPLIVGNWKMNLTLEQGKVLAKSIASGVSKDSPQTALCVPFTALSIVREAISGTSIELGAQDVFWEKSGAFTGEISAAQLADAGCSIVLIGHSERRKIFGETNASVQKKLAAVLAARLTPIVCIGETWEEREARKTWDVLKAQIEEGLSGFSSQALSPLVIAYEPVWAIGTGRTATPDQAQEAHAFIRKTLQRIYGDNLAQSARLLYGGSVKADNIDSLMAQPDLDGALVGGESLKADSFLKIMHCQLVQHLGELRAGQ
jgi:triosephosphate isomerase